MALIEAQAWSRRTIQTVEKPCMSALTQGDRPWLWLNGASSEKLEGDVTAVTGRFNHHWLWRGMEWEYSVPGYRQGPLLVPLDEALLETFLRTWAPASAGLIILTSADNETLLAHLRNLRVLTAADGYPVPFNLGMLRQLEELAEGLSAHRFAELLGPIHSLIWLPHENDSHTWLRAESPFSAPGLPKVGALRLTPEDEAAVNHANRDWFLRNTARQLEQQQPALTQALGPQELSRRLAIFSEEARGLGCIRERDTFHYLRLRVTYPQKNFLNDTVLRALLCNRTVDARLRLTESESRLQQLTSAPA